MLAIGLTPKANEQGYEPEWITAGLAFVEQDIVAQLIDKNQWKHSFGIAYNAESEPIGRSFPHAAYKTQRPNDEPAFGVEEIYYQLYMLAIGIQMAGPNLTPESFEAGMFAYPGGSGPRGGWGFGPGDYTPMDDFREIWWDTNRISPQNNKPGAWVQLNNGARYRKGTVPKARRPSSRPDEHGGRDGRPRRSRSSARRPTNPHLLRGYGPLAVGIVLAPADDAAGANGGARGARGATA